MELSIPSPVEVVARLFAATASLWVDLVLGVFLPIVNVFGLIVMWRRVMASAKVQFPDLTLTESLYIALGLVVHPVIEHLYFAPYKVWLILRHGPDGLEKFTYEP